ncbi:hypothetical protein [Aliarcobacter cryaerophilus]|uniref:hypothetical protein n=1 Tax=Aliarcobacter cryaerophilus TaxID=28198 RepID=UPI0011DF279F|nr:hypothetical protein [Aliarcobacter cryaerophilus]
MIGDLDTNLEYFNSNKLFNIQESKTFLRKTGGFILLDFLPRTLNPTINFYHILNKFIDKNKITGNKLPFIVDILNNPINLNINIRSYNKKIIILKVSLNEFHFEGSEEELLNIQQLNNHTEIYELVKNICGIIQSGGKRNNINYTPKLYPFVEYIKDEISDEIDDNLAVSLLTRHFKLKDDIVKNVIEKNKFHQITEDSFLLDKQGISARYIKNKSNEKKMTTSINLFEIALILEKNCKYTYWIELSKEEQLAINNLINYPNLVIKNSISGQKTWRLLSKEFNLEEQYKILIKEIEENKIQNNKIFKIINNDLSKNFLIPVIVGLLVFVGSKYIDYIINKKDKIILISPINYKSVTKEENVNFNWEQVEDAYRYILKIEIYDEKKEKWNEIIHNGYCNIKINSTSLELAKNARYRWKVFAKDKDENKITESAWSNFNTY